mgnify:CR=1 FL=1
MIATFAAALLLSPVLSTTEWHLEDFTYQNDQAIQRAWRSSSGTPQLSAQRVRIDGVQATRLPLIATGARSTWDLQRPLNLSNVDTIAFRMFVPDPEFAESATLYFRTGEGWLSTHQKLDKGWNDVEVERLDFRPSGKPGGWHEISGVRLSLWKKSDGAGEFYLEDIRFKREPIVVIRGRVPPGHSMARMVGSQPTVMRNLLSSINIDSAATRENDLVHGALKGRKIVVLPHNPATSEEAAQAIVDFLDDGGKVISFYQVHPAIMKAMGFKGLRLRNQSRRGGFAEIKATDTLLPGAPKNAGQLSWSIYTAQPERSDAKIISKWFDDKGAEQQQNALLVSNNGIHLSHVMLRDDLRNKEKLLRALVGLFDPTVWGASAAEALANCETVGEHSSLASARKEIITSKEDEALRVMFEFEELYQKARAANGRGNNIAATDLATQAKVKLIEAYCLAQKPVAGETKVLWCHDEEGVPGRTWDETMKIVGESGFDAVLANVLWGGVAAYNSKVLPKTSEYAKTGDLLQKAIDAGKKHGVDVHAWKVCWNLSNASNEFRMKMFEENRVQRDPQGRIIDWLCPSHPDNFALERDSMLEIVRNYDVAGVHFDYIRYPSSAGCYCDGCKTRFEMQFGVTVRNWPADALSGANSEDYREFRRQQITRLVKSVSEEAKKIKPEIQVSGAVFRTWPVSRDSHGQAWVEWVKNGYLTHVNPMDYTDDPGHFKDLIDLQLKATEHKAVFLPGIGVTRSTHSLTADQVIHQIKVARESGADGYTLFNLTEYMLTDVLPLLGKGATRKR